VVIIDAENHSFDNILGFWCDANPGRCPAGGMPSSVTLSDGAVVTPATDPDKVPSVKHNVASQLAAIDGGKMDGWQNISGCDASTGYQCVSGYQPSQVPNLTRLASSFAIADDVFSMADAPSWGGHIYAVSATLDHFLGNNPFAKQGTSPGISSGAGWGCDSGLYATWISPTGTRRGVPSCIPDHSLNTAKYPYGGAFQQTPVANVPTIMDRLGPAGLSWKIYGGTSGQKGYVWSICPTFAECLDTSQDSNLVTSPGFQGDAAAGALPSFSVVTPGGSTFVDSGHNSMSMTACDNWIGSLVQSVENGPDWSSTAIFITFDDFGGFYDQVPPPVNPDGTQEGPRLPLIIVSPYAKPGFTDNTQASFAGILKYTEDNFGLTALTANDASAYDFGDAFNYSQAPLKPVQMTTRTLPRWARRMKISKAEADDPT
jgi:phospholipase C